MKVDSAILLFPFVGVALALPLTTTVNTQMKARACNPEGPCYSDPAGIMGRAYSPVSGGYSDPEHVERGLWLSDAFGVILDEAKAVPIKVRACGNPDGPCYSDPGAVVSTKHHTKKISEKERLKLEHAVKHHEKISKKERLELEQANKHHHSGKISKKEQEIIGAASKHHYGTISHKNDGKKISKKEQEIIGAASHHQEGHIEKRDVDEDQLLRNNVDVD